MPAARAVRAASPFYDGLMRRRIGAAVLLALLAPVFVGCTPGGELPRSGPLAMYPRTDAGMDALFEGTLRLIDGCVVVEAPEGLLVLPVFPSGDASWSDGVLMWRDHEYVDGDAISLGGGGGGGPVGSTSTAYIPEDCVGLSAWWVSPY